MEKENMLPLSMCINNYNKNTIRVQVKMYLFQKESNTSNPIPPPSTAQFGILYYSAFRIIIRQTIRII